MRKIMTISGSDCSGGAGIQADIKAISSRGQFISSVVTAVVAENTMGVKSLCMIDKQLIKDQIDVIYEDMGYDAIKLGMLATEEIISATAQALKDKDCKNVVFDPCMVTKSDDELVEDKSLTILKEKIFPMVDIITPNIREAESICLRKINSIEDMKKACIDIHKMGVKNVLLKGGSAIENSVDILYDGENFHEFAIKRIESENTQGTGDVLAVIIADNLANGFNMFDAVNDAKEYVTKAIENAPGIGKGFGILGFFK